MERYFTAAVRLLFRADAAFAKPEIYEYLPTPGMPLKFAYLGCKQRPATIERPEVENRTPNS